MDIRAQFSNLGKDERVTTTLISIEQRLGKGSFRIVDHWAADLNATRIAHPGDEHLLAYIAPNASDSRYYVEFETAPGPESELPYAVAGQFNNVTFNELIELITGHFRSLER